MESNKYKPWLDMNSTLKRLHEQGFTTEVDLVIRETENGARLGCFTLRMQRADHEEFVEVGWMNGDKLHMNMRWM